MAKKKPKIGRTSRPRRVRGTPLFDAPKKPEQAPNYHLVKDPENYMDIARFLSDEVKKKWPEAVTPETVTGKHIRMNKTLLEEYTPENIREMIRVLVWDFDEIKKNKGFFPPSSHLVWPWLDQLHNYKHALASSIKKGVTDSTSRTSAYVQRYHSENAPQQVAVPITTETQSEESLKDLAKRMLGQ
jgi:hypothetical protein